MLFMKPSPAVRIAFQVRGQFRMKTIETVDEVDMGRRLCFHNRG